MILLDAFPLGLAAVLVLACAGLTHRLRLGTARPMLVAAARAGAQLMLVGLLLELLFASGRLLWVGAFALVMLTVAGYETMARQRRPLAGWWGYGLGAGAMFLSSFTLALFALLVAVRPTPWYAPQYAVPLLGMLLGNTMTGIALALDRLSQTAWEQRARVEGRLMLGQDWSTAIGEIRAESMRSGTTPTINALAAAGVVSLPGMMTGQILAGSPPLEAVKYQLLILLLIAAGTVLGTVGAVWVASRRLFDHRQRLRLDRLRAPR